MRRHRQSDWMRGLQLLGPASAGKRPAWTPSTSRCGAGRLPG